MTAKEPCGGPPLGVPEGRAIILGGTGFRKSWWVRRRKRRSKRRWPWERQTGCHRELGGCMDVSSLSIPLREEGNWAGTGRCSALGLAFLKGGVLPLQYRQQMLGHWFHSAEAGPPVPRLGALF